MCQKTTLLRTCWWTNVHSTLETPQCMVF
uniref:Uncharacterized protein n=1 Tax=Anguilla anguilla TaxID=7936 RepID=A0A0E9RBU2_ANGAN